MSRWADGPRHPRKIAPGDVILFALALSRSGDRCGATEANPGAALPPGSLSRPDVQRKPKILALPGMAPPPAPQSPCLNMTVSAQADGAFFAPDTAPQGVVTGEQIQQQAVYRQRGGV